MTCIREEYLAICDGDPCAAMILHELERYTAWKQEKGYDLSIKASAGDLCTRIFHVYGETRVKQATKWLRGVGFIAGAHEANPDRTLRYTFNTAAIQCAIDAHYTLNPTVKNDLWENDAFELIGQNYPLQRSEITDHEPDLSDGRSEINDGRSEMTDASLVESSVDPVVGMVVGAAAESAGAPESPAAAAAAAEPEPPITAKIFAITESDLIALYESERFGEASNVIRGQIAEAVALVGAEQVRQAMIEAVTYEKRNWPYVRSIIQRLHRERAPTPRPPSQTGDNRYQSAPDPGTVPAWAARPAAPKAIIRSMDAASDYAWDAAFAQLELQLDRPTFEMWLKGAVLVDASADRFVVAVANDTKREMCAGRLYRNIRALLCRFAAREVDVQFVTVSQWNEAQSALPAVAAAAG